MAKNFRIIFLSFVALAIGFINTAKGVELNLINRTGQDITISVAYETTVQTININPNQNAILDNHIENIRNRGFYININTPRGQKHSLGKTDFFVDYKKLNETEYEIQPLTEDEIAEQPSEPQQTGHYNYPPESLDPVVIVPYWVLTLSGTNPELGQTEYIYKPQ